MRLSPGIIGLPDPTILPKASIFEFTYHSLKAQKPKKRSGPELSAKCVKT